MTPSIPPERINDAMSHLIAAFEDFKKEALEANDPAIRKAALEDAAEVSAVMRAIENGLNRNKYDDAHLEAIAKGEN